jgi:hypothetical protein
MIVGKIGEWDVERINYDEKVKEKLKELNALEKVDWNKIKEAIEKKDGLVWDVSL